MNDKTRSPQVIAGANGAPEYAVLPWDDYQALVEAAEDAGDRAAIRRTRADLAAGREILLPADVADRILDGEPPLRVLRAWRGLTQAEVAEAAGIKQGYLSELETGSKTPSLAVARRLAGALEVPADLLWPEP
ncbi:MAG: helix-turn-helix transcriptional regulator [Rhodospirillales bacterium]|nr:helix-turn-helix transcriptional regulator [Rhodospirillales bacterium]MDH3910879.1 helix-turn-helix transcriptional regulator [Rhodospirillales bacterium]MDH3920960.1 helix-turn-helix transcriptional regulator [Rhodospirillales bacterium]MDH3968214.1 helix-turn-helix transcriptional regulator [Rhodospirillales bacterium]